MRHYLMAALLFVAMAAGAQEKIWQGTQCRAKHATLTEYLPQGQPRAAIIICPGGNYHWLEQDEEGIQVAQWLTSEGYAAYILKYRVAGKVEYLAKYRTVIRGNRYPDMICDLQRAIQLVKERFHGPVGVIGFSAGGHLAASASTLFVDAETRPDFSVLVYPVISLDPAITHRESRKNILGPREDLQDRYSLEKQVSGQTPPTFLALSADDRNVNPENSIRYFQALLAHKVPAQMYIYPDGGHGWGFTTAEFGRDGIAPYRDEFFAALNRFLSER